MIETLPLSANRFTVDGSDALEAKLSALCAAASCAVRQTVPESNLAGAALGGGYGRGEGGVLNEGGDDQPYNDLEFYVFLHHGTRGRCAQFEQELERQAHRLSAQVGIEVEFKVLTTAQFLGAKPSMFYFDLVRGHKMICGQLEALFASSGQDDARRIPVSEAARLLLNRGSGLLFALERLRRKDFSEEDADFVGRNIAKAQLALGDAILVPFGQYHESAKVRHERLVSRLRGWELGWAPKIIEAHQAGLDFKLHPKRTAEPRDVLLQRFAEIANLMEPVWLWIENQRLDPVFEIRETLEYALTGYDKCPEQPLWRNIAVNLKVFGIGGLRFEPGRYPRNRLFTALPILLWNADELDDPQIMEHVQRQLNTSENAFPRLVERYKALWERFR